MTPSEPLVSLPIRTTTRPRALARASRWITPPTMSPSRAENSPYVFSFSASRNRCSITWRAVVAATRPNPSGVSSHSVIVLPSSSTSAAMTLTSPVLRSISMRASAAWPSVCRYAVSSADLMVSTSSPTGIPRSTSMACSAAMSIFTPTPPSQIGRPAPALADWGARIQLAQQLSRCRRAAIPGRRRSPDGRSVPPTAPRRRGFRRASR